MDETNDNEPDIREVLRSVAGSMVGAVTVACIIAGHRTGLYQAMSGQGALSADEVAVAAGTNPRLTREWLDQQASAGLAVYESSSDTYRLPSAVAAALADPASPFWMAGGLVGTQALYLAISIRASKRSAETVQSGGGSITTTSSRAPKSCSVPPTTISLFSTGCRRCPAESIG
jgi:hypothetical protein